MKRINDIAAFVIVVTFFFVSIILTPIDNNNSDNVFTGFTFSPIYTGYAVPISGIVVNTSVNFATSTDTIRKIVDVTDDIIYRQAYISYDGQAWTPLNITSTGTGTLNGEWIYGRGNTSLTFTPAKLNISTSRNFSNNTYIIIYTCSKNTTAKNWSCHDGWQIVPFTTKLNTGSSSSTFTWTDELMNNGGFETGNLNGWTSVNGVTNGWNVTSRMSWNSVNVASQSGTYQAYNLGGGDGVTMNFYLYQDVSLLNYLNYIESGTAVINASGWGVSSEYASGADNTRIQFMFLDSSRNIISTVLDTGNKSNRTWWQAKISNYPIPTNARYVRAWGRSYEDCSWMSTFCDAGSLDSFSVKVGYGGTPITPPPCTSVCSLNAKQCSSSNAYQTCLYTNSDGCYEWGTATACQSGLTCSNGICSGSTCTAANYTPALNTFCGSKTVVDNCNVNSTKTGTLTCTTPQTCGGSGTPNTCGTPPSSGTTYYISDSGSDTSGTGSSASPWRSLYKACSTVKTAGNIIHVTAGTYLETSACNLAPGVSIEGEGVSSIIKSHITGEFNYLVYLSSGSEGANGNQHISGILFDGDNLFGSNAIIVNARSNVKIYGCTFQNFFTSGVVFNGGTGYIDRAPGTFGTENEFHDNVLTNCAYYDPDPNSDYGSGNLMIGGQSGMLIYNNVITQTSRGKGLNGYCIKHYSGGYNKGVKLYNNVLTTAPAAGPEPAYSWGFVLEQWNMLGGWEIYGNTIRGCLDLVHAVKGSYSFACDIHDNTIGFDNQNPALDTEGDVGIRLESNFEGVNIHNNHFKNMAMGIFATGMNGLAMKDLNIDYNLFTNLGTADLNDRGMALRYLSDGSSLTVTNWNVLNNVMTAGTSHSTAYGVQLPYGTVSNINIRNNIITGFSWAPVGKGASATDTNTGIYIENNIFYQNGNNNVPTYPSSSTVRNNIIGNPLFYSSTNFHLNASSPAIDKGISVGLMKDYEGKTVGNPPDIGAYEYP